MKKNGEYAGIDEKYIPEEEKYVDGPIIGDENESKEKIKSYVEKSGKVAKTIGIGYLCFIGLFFLCIIGMFVFSYKMISKQMKRIDDISDTAVGVAENIQSQMSNVEINDLSNKIASSVDDISEFSNNVQSQIQDTIDRREADLFNQDYELYSGTNGKLHTSSLLDNIITNNKKNKDKLITVIYNEISTTDSNEIIKIKHSLEDTKKYEIILDYDENIFVNKVTICDIK